MHNSPSINSHFNNLIHMIGSLPQGHEKPLKHALYNAVALLLLCACCAVCYALFLVLEPFFKPLLWALLLGSLLHPVKRSASEGMKQWFERLESSEVSFAFGLFALPFEVVNEAYKFVGTAFHNYYKVAGSLILSVIATVWLYKFFPWKLFTFVWQIVLHSNNLIGTILHLCNTTVFLTLSMGYIILLCVMWNRQREDAFRKTSLLVWLFCSSYIAHLTGSLKAVTFVFLQILALFGFILEVMELRCMMESKRQNIRFLKAIKWTILNKQNSIEFRNELDTSEKLESLDAPCESNKNEDRVDANVDEPYPVKARLAFQTRTMSSLPLSSNETRSAIESHILAALQRRAIQDDRKSPKFTDNSIINETDSTTCFKYLFWACSGMILWKHTWIWPLILIVITIFIVKSLGKFFGVWTFLERHILNGLNCTKEWATIRYSAIIPAHVNGIMKLIEKLNSSIYETAKESIDSVSSIGVILSLILFLICAPIFMGFQIYSEGITVIQLTGNLINSTVVHNPELRQLLPPGWDDTMDSLLDNAYVYGREGLSKTVKKVLQDTDEDKSAKLEKQVLELWDKLYQTWMADGSYSSTPVNSATIKQTWESFVDDLSKTPEMFNTNAIVDFAKQNVGTLLALLDSLWSLLKGNITLMLGSLSAITSVLLGGSSAVLNFILSLVVFFTTLFYLLNSSSTLYKPIELISKFSPINGSRLGLALTDAVNGVFKATMKMAVFYGLWTWFIHNLFGAKIVYLPSVYFLLK